MHDRPPTKAVTALNMYLALGPDRSLNRLVAEAKKAGISLSIATLKRWSARYGWQQSALEYDRAAGEKAIHELIHRNTVRRMSDLEGVRMVKEGTLEQLLEKFKRAKKPRVSQYLDLVKLEYLIENGRPMPRQECVGCRQRRREQRQRARDDAV